jgi:hypothetical protein
MEVTSELKAASFSDKFGGYWLILQPSFQSIADLPSTTGISPNAFLHSNHRNMPDFTVSSAESNDLIAYILSLKKR